MPQDIPDFNAGPVYNWLFKNKSREVVSTKELATDL